MLNREKILFVAPSGEHMETIVAGNETFAWGFFRKYLNFLTFEMQQALSTLVGYEFDFNRGGDLNEKMNWRQK